jgi:hypothetical protein
MLSASLTHSSVSCLQRRFRNNDEGITGLKIPDHPETVQCRKACTVFYFPPSLARHSAA